MVLPVEALGPVFGPVHGAAEFVASFTAASAFARAAVQTAPAALAVDAPTAIVELVTKAMIALATNVLFLALFTFLPIFS
jgi:hypothetical protein